MKKPTFSKKMYFVLRSFLWLSCFPRKSSKILGNVYSNGSVLGSNNAEIHGDLYVAGNTGIIDNVNVIKDV